MNPPTPQPGGREQEALPDELTQALSISRRILVCGSRTWADAKMVADAIAHCQDGAAIIHGAARGADAMAGAAARAFKLTELPFPANWDRDGKAAGPIRNSRMLSEGQPDLVLAFTDDLANSRGTRDMVNKSVKAGLNVYVIGHGGCLRAAAALAAASWAIVTRSSSLSAGSSRSFPSRIHSSKSIPYSVRRSWSRGMLGFTRPVCS